MIYLKFIWKHRAKVLIAIICAQSFWVSALYKDLKIVDLEHQAKISKIQTDNLEATIRAMKETAKALNTQQNEFNKISNQYEKENSELRTQKETTIKEFQTIIDRPVFQQQCMDADGLRKLNALIPKKARNTVNSSQSNATLR